MNAGSLRHRITIQSVTETKDTFGGVTEAWGTHAAVWASIEPLSGRELLQAQQVQADITHRVRMRYVAGVTTKMRVLYGSREFGIQVAINPEERNREIVLMCKEQV
jgi:SPP1 family predicted phage head-tail adaptor